MKTDELKMAKFMLDKLVKEYPSMFNEKGNLICCWSRDASIRETSPTRAKDDIRLIRRLLLEVSKEL